MEITYHYPPELFDLLVDTIPRLSRSKVGVIDFLRGAGVEERDLADLRREVRNPSTKISKFKIVRTVLARLNERGETTLRERREIIKRVVEFEDFSACWPNEQLQAKGLVAQIQKLVNVKDTFTRMKQERETERMQRIAASEARLNEKRQKEEALDEVKVAFYRLFAEQDVHKRGRLLESAMTNLFRTSGIPVREPFQVIDPDGKGIVEQVDGMIELDNRYFLCEMKWLTKNLGREAATEHLLRVYHRPETHGIFISATPFSAGALSACHEALHHDRIIVLCTLEEFVQVLEAPMSLVAFLRAKIRAVIAEKNPFPQVPIVGP